MKDNVYISSGVFGTKDLELVLKKCQLNGFKNLELGSEINYTNNIEELIFEYKQDSMNFILHNYFPPPRDPFVLNLGANDEKVLTQSIFHCKKAIDMAAKLKALFYSVHAGFAFELTPNDFGKRQTQLKKIRYKDAYEQTVTSFVELAQYAAFRGVKLAIENNVVAEFNLEDGENKILPFAQSEELLQLHNDVGSDNLFFLIDLGHLKVTSNSLKFDRYKDLQKLLPFTIAFHLSDNDAKTDLHHLFSENVWFREVIKQNKEKFFIIEVVGIEIQDLIKTCNILDKILDEE